MASLDQLLGWWIWACLAIAIVWVAVILLVRFLIGTGSDAEGNYDGHITTPTTARADRRAKPRRISPPGGGFRSAPTAPPTPRDPGTPCHGTAPSPP